MNLTAEERAILAHRVVDPDAWVAHALATVGEIAVREKIAKYREPYQTELTNRGAGYKDRATRQAEQDAALAADMAEKVAALAEAQAQREADATLVLATLPTREAKDAMARLLGVASR